MVSDGAASGLPGKHNAFVGQTHVAMKTDNRRTRVRIVNGAQRVRVRFGNEFGFVKEDE